MSFQGWAPFVVLELGHVFFGGRLLRERPGQHELGLEHGVEVGDEAVKGRRHVAAHRVLDPSLHVGDRAFGVSLVPAPVERLCGEAELDDEIVAQVLRFGFAAFFLPEPDQRGLVRAHNDPCVRPADELAAVGRVAPLPLV